MRKIIVATVLALMLVVSAAVPAFAYDTTAEVTVTATPAIISIDNAPDNWTINSTGDSLIRKATTYWSNDGGNTTSPTADPIAAGECRFTVTNDGTVAVDIEISMSSFTGGADPMTNSDGGTAGAAAGQFGAEAYLATQTLVSAVNLTIAGTADVITALASTGTQKWGIELATQTDDFTDAAETSSTVTLTATEV